MISKVPWFQTAANPFFNATDAETTAHRFHASLFPYLGAKRIDLGIMVITTVSPAVESEG
jgi:hypothetical protein